MLLALAPVPARAWHAIDKPQRFYLENQHGITRASSTSWMSVVFPTPVRSVGIFTPDGHPTGMSELTLRWPQAFGRHIFVFLEMWPSATRPLERDVKGWLVSGPLQSREPLYPKASRMHVHAAFMHLHHYFSSAFHLGIKWILSSSLNPAKTSTHPIRTVMAFSGPFCPRNSFPQPFLKSLELLPPLGYHSFFQPSTPPHSQPQFHHLPLRSTLRAPPLLQESLGEGWMDSQVPNTLFRTQRNKCHE